MRRLRGWWCLVLMCAVACSQPGGGGPQVDSNTNWLRACQEDADCGNTLSCICGQCTLRCEPDGCIFLEVGAVCAPRDEAGCPIEGSQGVCMPQQAPQPELLPPEPSAATILYPGPCSTRLVGEGILRIKHFDYNAQGDVREILVDDDGDGHIDRREQFQYDSLGRVGHLIVVELAQHEVLREEHRSYSGDRREPATITFDDNADGSVERRHILHYNAQGLLELKRVEQMIPEVELLSEERLVYDEAGHLLERRIDDDVDGQDDRTYRMGYDPSGQLVGQSLDIGLDHVVDARERYHLDAAGNRLETLFDDDNDGQTDRVETADFSCF